VIKKKNENYCSYSARYSAVLRVSAIRLSRYVLGLMLVLVFALCQPVGAQEEPAGSGKGNAAAPLVKALNSRFYHKRREARNMLEAMGPDAVKPLIEALKNDVSSVRSGAALVLGRMKVMEAIPKLLRLIDDPSLEVRKEAVEALGQVGTDAVDILREQLKGAEGRRKQLIENLLGRALEGAVAEYVKKMMITPGKCLYCPGPIEELKKLGPGVLEALRRLSDWTQYGTTSYYALNTIGDLGDEKAKDFLKKKYEDAKLTGTVVYRAGAAMALAKLGEPSYAQKVITDLKQGVYSTTQAGIHSSVGATYLEIGKLEEAEKEYLAAKKLLPEDLTYTFRLGCVYGAKGDAKKAVVHLKETVEKGFVKASYLQRVGYFKKIHESEEWKKFIEDALKKEQAESEKEKEAGDTIPNRVPQKDE
jgi:HEAT repeat protein